MKKTNLSSKFKIAIALAGALLFTSCQDSFFDEHQSPASRTDLVTESSIGILYTTGYQGGTWEELPGGGFGPMISGVKITFTKDDGTLTKTAFSDASGFYKIGLPAGKYYVVATHPDYEICNSSPGFFVVTGNDGFQTGNFFIKKLSYGFAGFTYVRNFDGTIGPKLANVKLTFTKNDGLFTKTVLSDASGFYKIDLPIGAYYSTAEKANYFTYNSARGVAIVDNTYSTYNFFLRRKFIILPI